MKVLNSWVAAVVACSAIASQANADVLMVGAADGAGDINAVSNLKSFDDVGNAVVEAQKSLSQVRPVFVSGSLINKSSTAA